jgi:hypothetical protein
MPAVVLPWSSNVDPAHRCHRIDHAERDDAAERAQRHPRRAVAVLRNAKAICKRVRPRAAGEEERRRCRGAGGAWIRLCIASCLAIKLPALHYNKRGDASPRELCLCEWAASRGRLPCLPRAAGVACTL